MAIGYMTNAFGPLYGTAAGVTCIKESGYYSDIDLEDTLKKISECGCSNIEIFEINLLGYENNIEELTSLCAKYGISILSVYIGCQFIYGDALPDELAKVRKVCGLAKSVNAKYIVFGGGSLRASGIQEDDHKKLAEGVDKAAAICAEFGLNASFHPHLGSLVQTNEQIHKFFSLTDVDFCPDIAHLVAGGSDAMELAKEYHDRISYVHLKDLSDDGEFCPLGTGKIDLKGIIAYLKSVGYKGDWMIEIDGYSGDPVEACKISVDFAKETI